MIAPIRLGFVGANVRSKWAGESHFPAIAACEEVELTAVCTTNPDSAAEAKAHFGARLAFSDYREMVASDQIDAVVVVVRVPSHYDPTHAAIEAGKHVYTEWPLARTTQEAEQLTALAARNGVQTATGLQARVTPELMHMRAMIAEGRIGMPLSVHVSCFRPGPLARTASRTWTRDVTQGANPLTIQAGHILDTTRYVMGEFTALQAVVGTQSKQWYQTDTEQWVDVTSPDNVLVNGRTEDGALVSLHVATVPVAPSGYRMEVFGSEGTLCISHPISSNHGRLKLTIAEKGHKPAPVAVPQGYSVLPAGFPDGPPLPVAETYARLAAAIRSGHRPDDLPSFDTALELHRLLDRIRAASNSGGWVNGSA